MQLSANCMAKLYFITHPQVNIIQGIPIDKWALSHEGIASCDRLASLDFWNNIDVIYSSPEKKALQTTKIIAKKNRILVKKKHSLREFDRSSTGFLQPTTYMNAIESFYANPELSHRGWETANSASERIYACVNSIFNQDNHKNIAIIGHGATGTLLVCKILGIDPTFLEDPQGVGVYMAIDWHKKKLILKWKKY